MAKLLLIDNATERIDVNEKNDIVGIFDDEHVFSVAETSSFKILNIAGKKAAEVRDELSKLVPKDLTESEKDKIPMYEFKIKDDTKTKISELIECKSKIIADKRI